MDYFILSTAPYVANSIMPTGMDLKSYSYKMEEADFEALEDLKVAYFKHSANTEICDILKQPTFIVSDKVKRLLSLYDTTLSFKGLQLFSSEPDDKTAPLYWVPYFDVLECLHPDSTKYDNGFIRELVLKEEAIGDKEIFRVKGLLEDKVIISLSVAESLLRRSLYGIGLQKVEVR